MTNQPIIRILQQNVQHSKAGTQQLIINNTDLKGDLLCIQETYNFSNNPCGLINLDVFCHNNNPRTAIATSLKNVTLIQQYTTSYCTCVRVDSEIPFVLCSVYLSPNSELQSDSNQQLNIRPSLEDELNTLQNIIDFYSDLAIIITGDFNGWHPSWGSESTNRRGDMINDFINNNLYILLNDGQTPTREYQNHISYVDLTFVNQAAMKYAQNWTVEDIETMSDHKLITFEVTSQRDLLPQSLTRKYRTKNISWEKFNYTALEHLAPYNQSVSLIQTSAELETFTTELTTTIQHICDNSLHKTKPRKQNIYWFTKELEEMHNKKKRLRRRLKRSNNLLIQDLNYTEYKNFLEVYKRKLITTKKNSIKDFFSSQNKETVWKKVYKWCKPTQQLNTTLKTIYTGTTWTSTTQETAEHLIDNFFPKDFTNNDERNLIKQLVNAKYYENDDIPITKEETMRAISEENDDKSPGEDAITANIIKQISILFPDLLTNLFNSCLKLHTFPRVWKQSTVKIIPKTNNTNTAKSYRPISLLPVMGKIFEKILTDRTSFVLYKSPNNLSDKQYGFTPQRSTEDAINRIIDLRNGILDSNQFGILISLDVAGAFDAAWWPKILLSLKEKHIPRNLFYTFKSYLNERIVKLKLGNYTATRKIQRGCPQGAKSSPLLWNVLYNELLELILPEGCEIQAFADDAFLICKHENLETCIIRTNKCLESISTWGEKNKLQFNPDKTKAMLVSKRKFGIPQLLMQKKMIKIVDHIKYLGVIIQNKKKWTKHVEFIINKAQIIYHKLLRASSKEWGLSGEVLRTIYVSAIEPVLCYACSAWAEALENNTLKRKLLSIQRNFAVAIIKGYRTISTEAALVLADITPIDLKIEYCTKRYLLKKGKQPTTNWVFERQIEHYRREHPAQSTDFTNCNLRHNFEIYTDGSKTELHTGAAFVVYKNDIKIYSKNYRLALNCTVYQAELFAILHAIKWCNNNLVEARINTDSLSSLQAIKKKKNLNFIVNEIRSEIKNNSHICLDWVKAHIGIEGNEAADQLAKEATKLTTIDYDRVPISFGCRLLQTNTQREWDNRWTSATTGRTTYKFFMNIAARRELDRIPDYVRTQFFTGHGFFRQYLHRFKRSDHDRCVCGEQQTSWHLLTECPQFLSKTINFKFDSINAHNYADFIELTEIIYRKCT